MMDGTARKPLLWPLLGCLWVLGALPARAFDDAAADRALSFAREQLNRTANNPAIAKNQYPKSSLGGPWKLVSNTDPTGWTQGFFPGLLWFMYEPGRETSWRTQAEAWTRNLEDQKNNHETHDLGFKLMTSFGNAYRLTGDPYYRDVLLTAAGSLATRFNPKAGVIDCCDWNDPPWHVALVTDTMVNLELLFWGARNGGNPAWNDMALSHALKTWTDMVRPDGGTFHVVDYNNSGKVVFRGTFQGYSDSSTWTRGQAWAIYGFTLSYRYTRDPRMLQAAQKTTDYYLARLPADSVPNWDFDAPANQQQKDSSSAAVVASALLELCQYVADPVVAQRYRTAALAMLDSLASPAYLSTPTANPGILLHGVAFYKTPIKPKGDDIDASLIYGDYYFVEALERFKRASAGGWYSTSGFVGNTRPLGASNAGVQIVEFDVTPLSKPIDGVIGYADSSTEVNGYARLAMSVRMNPEGVFDVRRGGEYAAFTRVPYQAHITYHVRLRADLLARKYSVWVRPPNGAEVLIADRFAFRTDAPPTDDLGQVTLVSAHFDDAFRVLHHTVRAETTTPGSGEEPPPTGEEPPPAQEPPSGEPPPSGEEPPPGQEPPTEEGPSSGEEPSSGARVGSPETKSDGCSTVPGATLVAAGLLPWLLRPRRPTRSRSSSPDAPTDRTAPR